ncbi:MAG TPA: hypothetical protein VFE98_08665 [Candidatus Bathyarchaeia archaeon]|nr:hypothetical protein [Candidatus Bathyarchaeia archaeon]
MGELPSVDLDKEDVKTWFGTKIRIEATIESDLYKQIQTIISQERDLAQTRDWPEVPISNVVEMILRKGVRAYLEEKKEKPGP